MKSFCIDTIYKYGKASFFTKANNGKEALLSLIEQSQDYKQILHKRDSDNMIIIVSSNKRKLQEVKRLIN
jgi:MFS superfamily sulfate permease-like transporter